MHSISHHVNKFLSGLLLACPLSISLLAQGQDIGAEVQSRFTAYQEKTITEKLYIHTDKSFYLAGEIIWYKLYCVNGSTHHPLNLSKVAYIELLDKDNKPVMLGKVGLKDGLGNGSFYLPSSLNAGNYVLRAYTNWMKNFGPDYFYHQTLTIVNSLKPLPVQKPDTSAIHTAGFYPEGGQLVQGVASKVAFQVTDKYGKGCAFTGTLMNQRQETLLQFTPNRFGIGQFRFTPAAGDRYTAIVVTADGKTITKELPAALEQGYVMQLQEEANGQLTIQVQAKLPAGLPESVFLFAHSRQVVKGAYRKALVNGVALFSIDKSSLGEGISHFTVFNAARQPVCERLYCKLPAVSLDITASGQNASYGNRKKVDIQLQTAAIGKQIPANLSLSIYRVDELTPVDANNILSYLWLSSDLKGKIESPGYYFSAQTPEVTADLDNLMLVHGWRKFNWAALLDQSAGVFQYIPEFDGHLIAGRITHATNNTPVASTKTYLSIAGSKLQFYPVLSSPNGEVRFDVRNYYGPGEIIIQTEDQLDSNYHVDIRNPYSGQFAASYSPAPLSLSPSLQQSLTEGSINMQVQNAYYSERLSQFNISGIDTTPFFGRGYPKYILDDYVRFTTTEEILREYVPDVAVRKSDGQFQLFIFNWEAERHYRSSPLVLLDGVPVSVQTIMTYDPLKMRQLQVVTDRYVTGEFTYDGIISFTTYHGDLNELKLDSRAVILDYDGLQLHREFYAPSYETNEQASSRLPDFRNVLYWNGNIQTDGAGKAGIHFFTSDLSGKFAGVIQGIDTNGHAGSTTFTFEVK